LCFRLEFGVSLKQTFKNNEIPAILLVSIRIIHINCTITHILTHLYLVHNTHGVLVIQFRTKLIILQNIFIKIALTGIAQVGVFRQPGRAGEVHCLSDALSTGQELDLESLSVHTLCFLVKVGQLFISYCLFLPFKKSSLCFYK